MKSCSSPSHLVPHISSSQYLVAHISSFQYPVLIDGSWPRSCSENSRPMRHFGPSSLRNFGITSELLLHFGTSASFRSFCWKLDVIVNYDSTFDNSILFVNRVSHQFGLPKKYIYTFLEYPISALSPVPIPMVMGTYESSDTIPCCWLKPEEGWIMCNTDASLSRYMRAGIGFILRDDRGEVAAAGTGTVPPSTILYHDLETVATSLSLALRYKFQRVVVATDSTSVVYLVNGIELSGIKLYGIELTPPMMQIFSKILRLRDDFDEVLVLHVYRETNRAADYLSRLVPNSYFEEVIPSLFLDDLKKTVYEDHIGKVYHRYKY